MGFVVVEPVDGDDLDRLITALVNVTGVVHQLLMSVERETGAEGVELIDLAADRLHEIFCVIAEQYDDDELAELTGTLALATLLVADELGLGDTFRTA
jgi:hypothetical protein